MDLEDVRKELHAGQHRHTRHVKVMGEVSAQQIGRLIVGPMLVLRIW